MANHADFIITITGANGHPAISRAFDEFTKFDSDDLQFVSTGGNEIVLEIIDDPWHDIAEEITAMSEGYPEWDIRVRVNPESGDPWHARAKGGSYLWKNSVITYPEITDEELEA